ALAEGGAKRKSGVETPHSKKVRVGAVVTSLFDPPVDLLAPVEFLIAGLMGRVLERLPVPQGEEAGGRQAFVQQAVNTPREGLVEINQDVPAEDDVELVERAVGDQVVLGEDDVLRKGALENDVVVLGGVILGEGTRAARLEVVAGVLLHRRQG